MSEPRRLFDELMAGVDAMRDHREAGLEVRTREIEGPPPLAVAPELIRETRERLHVSPKVFAKCLRVSPRTLEGWEQGRARPNPQATALILMVRTFPDTLDKLAALDRRPN